MITDRFNVEQKYLTRPDGTRLAVYFWERADKDAPLLFILHGMAEYGARYKRLVGELAHSGWSFASFDYRGHGHSTGERMRMPNFETALADVEAVFRFVGEERGGREPTALFGHSMGGLLAALFTAKCAHRLKGLVLSSPAFGLYAVYPFIHTLVKLLYRISPNRVMPKPVVPEKLTHDPEIQKEYLNDPFIYKFTGIDLLYGMVTAMKEAEALAPQITTPLLMILAEREYVTNVRSARTFFEKAGSADKKLHVLPNFYHEVFNELRRAEPIELLKEFLIRIQ